MLSNYANNMKGVTIGGCAIYPLSCFSVHVRVGPLNSTQKGFCLHHASVISSGHDTLTRAVIVAFATLLFVSGLSTSGRSSFHHESLTMEIISPGSSGAAAHRDSRETRLIRNDTETMPILPITSEFRKKLYQVEVQFSLSPLNPFFRPGDPS